jgi:hypothetical protein
MSTHSGIQLPPGRGQHGHVCGRWTTFRVHLGRQVYPHVGAGHPSPGEISLFEGGVGLGPGCVLTLLQIAVQGCVVTAEVPQRDVPFPLCPSLVTPLALPRVDSDQVHRRPLHALAPSGV